MSLPGKILSGLQLIAVKALSKLPLWFLYLLSSLISPFLEYILRYRRMTVEQNLRNAFPHKPVRELRKIRKKFYRNFTDLSFEIGKALHWDSGKIMKRIRVKNEALLLKLAGNGQPVLVAMGHCGNWEWMNAYAGCRDIPVLPVYKELNHPGFNKLFHDMRTRLGSEPVPMKRTLRAVKERIDQQKTGLFCFLADQHPVREELEFFTDFLNQDTPVFLGIEKLARRYNLAVVFMAMHRLRRGYYEAEFLLVSDAPTLSKPFEITNRHVQMLESQILADPPNWMWSHRRWKFSREDMMRKKVLYGSQRHRE